MIGALLLALAAAVATPAAPPRVTVPGGQVEGERTVDRLLFRGIPYAAPPVGQLRWRAPARVRGHRGQA